MKNRGQIIKNPTATRLLLTRVVFAVLMLIFVILFIYASYGTSDYWISFVMVGLLILSFIVFYVSYRRKMKEIPIYVEIEPNTITLWFSKFSRDDTKILIERSTSQIDISGYPMRPWFIAIKIKPPNSESFVVIVHEVIEKAVLKWLNEKV